MTQYIDKAAVVAEIKKKIKKYATIDVGNSSELDALYGAKCKALMEILSFLDTLEVKEINTVWHDTRRAIPEDGSEQIICIKEDGLAVSTVGKIVNGTIKWAYLGDLLLE